MTTYTEVYEGTIWDEFVTFESAAIDKMITAAEAGDADALTELLVADAYGLYDIAMAIKDAAHTPETNDVWAKEIYQVNQVTEGRTYVETFFANFISESDIANKSADDLKKELEALQVAVRGAFIENDAVKTDAVTELTAIKTSLTATSIASLVASGTMRYCGDKGCMYNNGNEKPEAVRAFLNGKCKNPWTDLRLCTRIKNEFDAQH